jgi:hypothetical protein
VGWSNSVPIFHGDVTYTLQDEIPDITIPFLDDAPIKGPLTRYELPNGSYETHPDNTGIRRFVWEHFQSLNRIVQHIKYVGCTWSGPKAFRCVLFFFFFFWYIILYRNCIYYMYRAL